jgi:hypothetical protein
VPRIEPDGRVGETAPMGSQREHEVDRPVEREHPLKHPEESVTQLRDMPTGQVSAGISRD